MSCCGTNPGYDELDEVSRLVATKLAAFLKTLRDNAFIVGLHEGRDAAALMAAGYAEKPALLRSAIKHLFSARKSDWEKFDGLFDAFWLGKRVKSRSVTMGSAKAANSPSLKSLQDAKSERSGSEAASDQVPSADEPPEDRAGGAGPIGEHSGDQPEIVHAVHDDAAEIGLAEIALHVVVVEMQRVVGERGVAEQADRFA